MYARTEGLRPITLLSIALLALHCSEETGDIQNACEEAGGACAHESACPRGEGHLGVLTCDSDEEVCCLPLGECGAEQEPDCCSDTETVRPLCIEGSLECPEGTSQLRCEFDYCGGAGGSCTTIGDCGPGEGHLGLENCGFPPMVCCFPEGSCNADCCSATAIFRPYCIDGHLSCAEGSSVEQCEEGP